MEFFELIRGSIDVPLVAAMVFAFLQIIKQTKFPNKYLPVASFVLGMLAGVIKLGATGALSLATSVGIFSLISASFLYGAGAIAIWAILNRTFNKVGKSIEQAFAQAYFKTTGRNSYADDSNLDEQGDA